MNPMTTRTGYGSTELEIAATMLRVSNSLRTRLDDALTRQNVSWAGYEVLGMICTDGPMTYRMLADRLDRHRTSVTSIVAGLVSSGRATRRLGGYRRDEFMVEATPTGYRTYELSHRALTTSGRTLFPARCPEELLDHLSGLERALRGH